MPAVHTDVASTRWLFRGWANRSLSYVAIVLLASAPIPLVGGDLKDGSGANTDLRTIGTVRFSGTNDSVERLDCGILIESSRVELKLKIENSTATDLQVTEAKSRCRCVSVEQSGFSVPPHETRELIISIAAPKIGGRWSKTVVLATSAGSRSVVLEFKVEQQLTLDLHQLEIESESQSVNATLRCNSERIDCTQLRLTAGPKGAITGVKVLSAYNESVDAVIYTGCSNDVPKAATQAVLHVWLGDQRLQTIMVPLVVSGCPKIVPSVALIWRTEKGWATRVCVTRLDSNLMESIHSATQARLFNRFRNTATAGVVSTRRANSRTVVVDIAIASDAHIEPDDEFMMSVLSPTNESILKFPATYRTNVPHQPPQK